MSYELRTLPNHTVEIVGHLEADDVNDERNRIVEAFRRRAQIPGFRNGRAPLHIIRTRFASEIQEELVEHLAGNLWSEVMTAENDLQPITPPKLTNSAVEEDGVFRLTAEVEVRPNYDLPDLEGFALPEVEMVVSAAEVEAEFDKLRDEQASWEPADDAQAEDGMLVEADLVGEPLEGDEEPFHEDDARFLLGGDGIPAELNEALQGARVGDEKSAQKRFAEDDPDNDRAGRTVNYTVKIKSLKRKVLPDLDDELAKAIGVDSLDEVRERIEAALLQNKKVERRSTWRRALLDHLQTGADPVDLPNSLVQAAIHEDVNRFAYTLAMRGMAPDADSLDWQELSAKLEPQSRARVLDSLVLEQVADELEISVPEDEVDRYVNEEAMRMGKPPAEHKANLATENRLDELRHAARISAAVDALIIKVGGEVDS
ncbi:MAG: trigger factor [bacterium]|nr:trigger factor [bacterium]